MHNNSLLFKRVISYEFVFFYVMFIDILYYVVSLYSVERQLILKLMSECDVKNIDGLFLLKGTRTLVSTVMA